MAGFPISSTRLCSRCSLAAIRETLSASSFTRPPDISITFSYGQLTPAATGGLVSSIPSGRHGLTESPSSGVASRESTPDEGVALFRVVSASRTEAAPDTSSLAIRSRTWGMTGFLGKSRTKVLSAWIPSSLFPRLTRASPRTRFAVRAPAFPYAMANSACCRASSYFFCLR